MEKSNLYIAYGSSLITTGLSDYFGLLFIVSLFISFVVGFVVLLILNEIDDQNHPFA